MSASPAPASTRAWPLWLRMVALLSIQDSVIILVIVPIWVYVFEAADLVVLTSLALMRTLAIYLAVFRRAGPVSPRLRELRTVDDAALLNVDAMLQRGPRRMGHITAFSWAAVLGLSTASAALGVPTQLEVDAATLLVSTLMVLAITLGTTAVAPSVLEALLVDARTQIATELHRRELGSKRVETTLAGTFNRLNIGYILAVFYGLSALATMLLVDSWRAVAAAEQAPIDDHLGWIIAFVAIGQVVVVIPLLIGNQASLRAIVHQVDAVRRTTARVLETGDITNIERFEPPRNDELGGLTRDFNGLIAVLAELADAAHAVAEGKLDVEFERPGDLHGAFRGMLAQLREVVARIRVTSADLEAAASELRALTREQESAVTHQSASIADVSATVQGLAAAAMRIEGAAGEVLNDAEQTRTTTEAMAVRIATLRTATRSIAELLEQIREIADRSDILALNGALEATRAGDAGRGFALVAGEMRRLAERITTTVVDVGVRVREVEEAGSSTVETTEASLELAARTAKTAQDISELTTSQGRDTQLASQTMAEVAMQVLTTATATAQTQTAAERLQDQAHALHRLTERFSLGASSES